MSMEDKKALSRRRFLQSASMTIGAAVLAACAPPAQNAAQPTAAPADGGAAAAPTTAPAAVEATAVPAAEGGASTGALAAPVPYAPSQAMAGSQEPRTFSLDEWFTYKKLDTYSEPDYIAEAVAAGTLPPVAERLPEEPLVYLNSFFSDGPGEYGGVMRDVWAVSTEGWNWGAGVVQGYFGIDSILVETLVLTGPIWLRSDGAEPLPNLAKSWEWSEDGKQLTMNIVKGIKWSDGMPFTTDDIMFTWEDLVLDPGVTRAASKRSTWQIDGQDINLEKIDDYTIRWTFPVERPTYFMYFMNENYLRFAPAHIHKPSHPKYNPSSNYDDFMNNLPPDNLPVVTIGPWTVTNYKTDEIMIFRRNPYFWKVDENGKQLPYLNEIIFEKANTGVIRTTKVMAGAADHTNVENPSTFREVATRAQDPNAPFRLEWGPETLGFSLIINQALNFGPTDDRTRENRKLFRDVRFRKALSYAIDREGIARSVADGPFFRAWPGGLYPGAQFFDADSTVYYPFSIESAKALLAEIGFTETNSEGILLWPEGPLAGQPLLIGLIAGQDADGVGTIAEALVPLFKQIGVQVNFRLMEGNAINDLNTRGEWEMQVNRMGQEWGVPEIRYRDIAPQAIESPNFNRAAEGVERVLQDFEVEMVEIVQKFVNSTDNAERVELMKQYQKLHTENCYTLGVVIGRYALGMSKTLKNIPVGSPAFLYQWDYDNYLPEQFWIAPEDQSKVPETQPGVIPTYK
jgi:peptide/nickel transport system substrate-binding protein